MNGCMTDPVSEPKELKTLIEESEKDHILDGEKICEWMNSSAFASAQGYSQGYQIVEDRETGTLKTAWCFEQDGYTYLAESFSDAYHPQASQHVSLIRADEKNQVNINLIVSEDQEVLEYSSFERDPLWEVTDHTFMKMPLLDLISADGIAIVRAYPEEFEGEAEISDQIRIVWQVKNAESLLSRISKGPYSKSGYYAADDLLCSWRMDHDGLIQEAEAVSQNGSSEGWTAKVSALDENDPQKQSIIDCFDKYPLTE